MYPITDFFFMNGKLTSIDWLKLNWYNAQFFNIHFQFLGGSNYKDENLNKYELSMRDPHPLIHVLFY